MFRPVIRFLSSLWLGITLIALLTAGCIYGSILSSDASKGVDYGREHVFHTWWFLGIMGLLLVNLVLCSWEKSYIALTLYKKRNFIQNPDFYRKSNHAYALTWTGPIERVQEVMRRGYTVARQSGNAIYAQKGLLGRCGATIIHIGLIWTMAAGYYRILADDFGWGVFDSTVVIPEGGTTQSYYTRIDRLQPSTEENLREKPLPFRLRALDFRADYYPNSTVARHFSSLIEVQEPSGKSQISEISMATPMLYNGYKITQNSFSENPQVRRGQYRIVDTQTGSEELVDAGPNDPVRLRKLGGGGLFFEVKGIGEQAPFRVVDLSGGGVLYQGNVETGAPVTDARGSISMEGLTEQLADSRYAYIVAALFPNFRINDDGQPTTENERFENPAVMVMLFKNGQPNGHTWAFLDKNAQSIMGHPHPEVEVDFLEYRKAADASGSGGLMDYEVRVAVRQKTPAKALGEFWTKPGALQEVAGVDDSILSSPAATPDPAAHSGHSHDHETTAGLNSGGAAGESSAGGNIASADTASPRTGAPAAFRAYYVGDVAGHITYLGFMQDPSVGWLFTGCIIIILGTLVAFLIPYREVWAWHDGEGTLYLATAVRGTSPRSHREFDRLARLLARETTNRPLEKVS